MATPPNNWSLINLVGYLVNDDNDQAANWSVKVESSQTRLQDATSHRIIFPGADTVTPGSDGYFCVPAVISDTDSDITPAGRSHKITLLRSGAAVQSWFVTIDHTSAVQLRFDGSNNIVTSGGTLTDALWITSLTEFTDAPTVTPVNPGGGGSADLSNYFTKAQTTSEADARIARHSNPSIVPDPHGQYALDSDLAGKANTSDLTAHSTATNNPHAVTKSQVGLSNVDNTSDATKQTAYDARYFPKPDETGAAVGKVPAVVGTNPTTYGLRTLAELGATGGGSGSPASIDTPANVMYARFATRDAAAVPIVSLGSSTAAGTDAAAVLNRLVALLQVDFPLLSGAAQPAAQDLAASMSLANGIQHIRGAVGGTSSNNYCDSAKAALVGALKPPVILHVVGSNDYRADVVPSTYKTNMLAALDRLDAVLTQLPYLHVLVHAHRRTDNPYPSVYPWSAYGTALREICAARTNCLFVDWSTAFYAAQVDTGDPLGLILADKTHLTGKGNAFAADLTRAQLRLTAALPSTFTAAADTPDTTPPSVPTSLAATPGNAQVALTWTSSTDNMGTVGAVGYRVYRGGTLVGSPTGTSFTDTGRTNGTSYSYQVSAVDGSGNESAKTAAVSATPSGGADTTAPTISTFTATPGNAQVALAWAGSDNVGITRWVLTRSGTTIYDGANAGLTDTGRTNGTSYSYSLLAYDAAGNVSTAANATATPTAGTDTQAPTVPTGLAAGTPTASTVPLSWTASTDNVGVTGYRVRRGGTLVGSPTATSFTDTGLAASTAYSYTVSAVDAAGNESAQTTAVNATTAAGSGSFAPTDLSGLHGWWKADSITAADGDPIQTWNDSGPGARAASQTGASSRPVYVANQLNGKPVLRFDGTRWYTVPGASGSLTTCTMFAVVKPSTAIQSTIYGPSGSGGLQWTLDGSQYLNLYNGSTLGASAGSIAIGVATVFGLAYSDASLGTGALSFFRNGSADGSPSAPTATVTAALTARIGIRPGGHYMNGDIAEIVVYDRVLSSAERKSVTDYLGAKYGITVA